MNAIKVRKRDGKLVDFDLHKVQSAVSRAFASVNRSASLSKSVSEEVVRRLKRKVVPVEEVQDMIEKVLVRKGYADAAKAYILYRQKRSDIREAKHLLGVNDELKLNVNSVNVLHARYLKKDERGEVIETPKEMFMRVAKAVAKPEDKYNGDVKGAEKEFYEMMANLDFMPNSPTLMNAGTSKQMLSACFVLPIEDSLEQIFESVKQTAVIEQVGGGIGFSFSKLRPKGDIVGSTKGVASGPVSFMNIFDTTTEVIKQGSRRRGAMMGILDISHPDIVEFITSKSEPGKLRNFNISVAVDDRFMRAVKEDKDYPLVSPRTKQVVRKVNARELFVLIATLAWRTGDPGIIFIDEVNRSNPTPKLGRIESTNPCGESPLLSWESCNLGSINLSRMVKSGKIDYDKIRDIVRKGVHFLDNVIDANRYPVKEIERITMGNRKIGLGVMGFAEMLIQLNVPYDSERALAIASKLMQFISDEADMESVRLANRRGSFPNKRYSNLKFNKIRNATRTSIAPTGTISIISQTSSGIEPLFAISFIRDVLDGTRMLEVNTYFENVARERGFYSKELMMEISKMGSIHGINGIPDDVKRVFVTALDIKPEWHVRMQAAFQSHTDLAVSKTVNLPVSSSIQEIKDIYMLAYRLKCKGITVYRYGSKEGQVLYIGEVFKKENPEEVHVKAHSEYAGGCPAGECPF